MEASQPHDASQVHDTQGEKAEKKKRRKKKEGSEAASPEAREGVDPSKAATSPGKKHRSKVGKRKHHDQDAAPEPNPENAEGAAPAVGQEEAQTFETGDELKTHEQPRDDHNQSGPGSVEPHEHQKPPGQQGQQDQQLLGQQERPQKTQKETVEQLQDPNQLKQPEGAGGPDDISLAPGPLPILAVCILFFVGFPLSVLIFKTFPTPAYRCLNPACTDVLDYMDAIVDKRVRPCHDFYRHVCGHWLPKSSQTPTTSPSSFMAEVLRNYTARRHRQMMKRTGMAEPADAVSRYYSHCVAYLGVPRSLQDIVSKVYEVYNTKAQTWLGMSSDQIFAQLLRLSFVYRLHALFKITSGKIDRENYIAVDRWTSFKQRLPNMASQDHTYLAAVLKVIGGKDVSEAIIASCAALDDSIGLNETHRPDSSNSLEPASNTDCPEFPPEKWLEGTSSQNEVKLPAGTSVFARDFTGTCSVLRSVLLHEMPLVKALYPLALLVEDFLKLNFMRTSESKIDPELVQKVCHEDTMATFKRLWLPSLTKVLSILPTTAQTVDYYYYAIQRTIQMEASRLLKWMSDADRTTTLSNVKNLHIARFSNGSLSREQIDNSRYSQSLDMGESDWIYNKRKVLRRTKISDDVDEDSTIPEDEQYSETVEVQLLADTEKNAVVVPHMFAVPPLFFDVISRGSYANLAMLGFQMARKVTSLLFGRRAGPRWSKETDSKYRAARMCYASTSGALHGSLSDAQFDEAFEAAVAIKAVFQARSQFGEDVPKSEAPFSSKQLFFKRACLSLCAGVTPRADFNSLDRDTASAACTIAVSSMSEFHEAFACGGSDQMTQPLRCNI